MAAEDGSAEAAPGGGPGEKVPVAPVGLPEGGDAPAGLLPDWGGWRSRAGEKGVEFGVAYTGEVMGVARGGAERGAVYQGLFEAQIELDTAKAGLWEGGSMHAGMYLPHGDSLTGRKLGDLFTFSNIDAPTSPRLHEAWIEQRWFEDRISLRGGQLAADTEFAVSEYGGLFTASGFGWPPIPGVIVPTPAYPIATPGARLEYRGGEKWGVRMAAYNGDPTPVDANGDPTNQHGIDFGWRSVFSIVEWEGRWDRIGSTPGRLPGVLKVGAWHHSGEFDDLHRDADGRSLADPASSGQARVHEGNFGAYLVAETLLVREEPPAERDPAATSAEEASVQGLGWFGRFGGAPGDRSAFEYYAESGLTYAGLFPGRDEDVFGVGCGYGQIGHGWRGRELDAVGWGAAGIVPPDYEIVTEVSYRAVFKRGLMIQPTVAWVVHPGGSAALEDALVLGLRARVDL